tara:strand:- start:200 stop:502 length:303 start_codon:yes stop_codon:yes gene_type:complete
MDWDRAKEIGTMGGCGLVALAVLKRNGGTPMVRYEDGNATHAAVMLDGQLVHLGDNEENMVEVTELELRRAITEDFDVQRVSLQSGEIRRVLEKMELWNG